MNMGSWNRMKTRIEVPGALFRKFTSCAAGQKPWMKLFGKLRRLRKETAQVNQIIEDEFERIDPEDWR